MNFHNQELNLNKRNITNLKYNMNCYNEYFKYIIRNSYEILV